MNDASLMRSPEWVQLSHAAAITLGLQPGLMHGTDCTHCLNLLLTYPEGCRANCAYCGLARHRQDTAHAERNFIRVDWPLIRFDEVLERMDAGGDKGRFKRMCLSMITHPRSGQDTEILLDRWVNRLPHVPVSILSNPSTMGRDDLLRLRDKGADIFTVALDAVEPQVFARLRGVGVRGPHDWGRYWRILHWAAEIFGRRRFGAHLICGLGETERDFLATVQRVIDLGGHCHLFAFFPERGSLMENQPACERGQWRRIQLARFLMEYRGVRLEAMAFDPEGRVVDFGCAADVLEAAVYSSRPFRTSGCPGPDDPEVTACDRPYGDSRPSDIMSYPFAPDEGDLAHIRRQLFSLFPG